MQSKILKIQTVIERTGLKRSSIYRLAAIGKFPKQIKLGERASGWIESEVDSWIEARISLRTA